MPRYNLAPNIGTPTPLHWLTASAEAARLAVRERRARAKRHAELVTEHPRPHSEVVPASATALITMARAAGFEVRTVFGRYTMNLGKANEASVESVKVAGLAERAGFEAVWVRGAAKHGVWYQPHREEVGVAVVKARLVALAKVRA